MQADLLQPRHLVLAVFGASVLRDTLLSVTVNSVLAQLLELTKREANHEITQSEATEEMSAIVNQATLSLSEADLMEVQCKVLTVHHLAAKELSRQGAEVPGNDPLKPN